jgi:hypothetical protein
LPLFVIKILLLTANLLFRKRAILQTSPKANMITTTKDRTLDVEGVSKSFLSRALIYLAATHAFHLALQIKILI